MFSSASVYARKLPSCSGLRQSAARFGRSDAQWPTRLVPLGWRRGLGLPLNLPATPGPLSFDFHPKRDTQECSDQDYDRKHAKVAKCRSDRDRSDDISSDQEFEPQQDASSKVGSIRWQNGAPIRFGKQRTCEPRRRGNCYQQNGRDACNLESCSNPVRSDVESGAGRRVRYGCLVRACARRGERSNDHCRRSQSKMYQIQPYLLKSISGIT